MRNLISCLILLFLSVSFSSDAQDFSNKGKDFWIAYPAHVDGTGSIMGLYITSDVAATGTVLVGTTTLTFSITPNTVKRFFIGGTDAPNTQVYLSQSDGISTTAGIRVQSNQPVVVYAHIIRSARSGASLIIPTNVWGREYLVPSYRSSGSSGANSGYGEIAVMAKEANTVIEITPSKTTRSGKPAGTAYTVTLAQPGDVYQVQFNKDEDISGTKVRSIASGTSTCKPIAVFSASTWSAFDCVGASGGDNLYQMLFPTRAFGRSFLTAPFINRNYDIVRVFVTDPSTVVTRTVAGATTTLSGLTAGSYYEFTTNLPTKIDADKPVSVVQYITSQSCFTGASPSDPEMVILNPVEQTINNITVFSAHQNFVPTGQSNVNRCYLNIIIKTAAAPSFKINGAAPSGNFQPVPGTIYSYLQEDVTAISATNPVQTLKADSSFSCIAYGYGNVESYGYNAGTNVKDLYQYVTIKNPNASVNFPATCVNTPFNFSITLPYTATSLKWLFYGTSPDVVVNNPIPDSTFVLDGKTLNLYKLTGSYQYSTIGTYKVTVVASNPTSDGCNGEQEIDYDLEVFQKPTANFSWTHNGCLSDSVRFTDAANGLGRTITKWKWEFGDNTVDSVKNPAKKYTVANTYTVKETITTDVGCTADTSKVIQISNPPIALFTVALPACMGVPVTFTDASSINSGTIQKRYWDFGNGQKDSAITNDPKTVVYNTPGTYTVSFFVVSSTGCISNVFSRQIVINPAPKPDFILPGNICLPIGLATFTNTTTLPAPGNVNLTKYKWSFGDGGSSTLKNPTHNYAAVGNYIVTLTATSDSGCIGTITKSVVDIFPQPKADFNLPNGVCFKDSTRFFDASTPGQGQTLIKYGWNFGDNSTDTLKNPVKYYAAPNTYVVKHWAISDKGCYSDTVTKSALVNPLPTVDFTISTPACETRLFTFTPKSVANTGNIISWYWNFGDGNIKALPTGNPFTYTYNTAGTRTISHAVITDKGCKSDTLKKAIAINPLPKPDFVVPDVCLSDAFAVFTNTSTITDGSAAQFTYAWTYGDPNANAGNPNTSTLKDGKHRYSSSGNYNVVLKVVSKDGCVDSVLKVLTVNGDKPKADFAIINTGNICAGDVLQIKENSTVNFGKITKVQIYWEWPGTALLFTDDTPTLAKTYSRILPDFSTPVSKTFQIRYLAYSGIVCVDEIIKTITVNARPKVAFSTLPGICVNALPRQITQAANVGSVSGSGAYRGPGVSTTGLFNPTTAGVGTHTVWYKFTSTFGCLDSAKQTITVWPLPTANFTVDSPTCINSAITLRDASVANANKLTKWSWDFGDGTNAIKNSNAPFTQTYNVFKGYSIVLQVTSDSGCSSLPFTKNIIANPLPEADFTLPIVCLPLGTANFTDKSTIADASATQFTYLWNFGLPGATSTQKNPTYRYTAVGPFNVSLIVTSKNGCRDTATKIMNDINAQPLANFDAVPPTVCIGDIITFNDKSNPLSQTIIGYKWDFSDNTSSTLQNPAHTYTQVGTYNVSMYYTTAIGCNSDTIKKSVKVFPYPVVNAGPDMVVLEGGQKQILASVSGGTNYQYQWLPATYLNSASVLQPITSPKADITYTLTVTSEGGCKASDAVFVKLLLRPEVPNAFSPNGDGINDTWNIKYLESYPGATVQLFDRYGRQVLNSVGYSKQWDGNQNGIPVPVGVYYYIVDPKNGRPAITGSVTVLR